MKIRQFILYLQSQMNRNTIFNIIFAIVCLVMSAIHGLQLLQDPRSNMVLANVQMITISMPKENGAQTYESTENIIRTSHHLTCQHTRGGGIQDDESANHQRMRNILDFNLNREIPMQPLIGFTPMRGLLLSIFWQAQTSRRSGRHSIL